MSQKAKSKLLSRLFRHAIQQFESLLSPLSSKSVCLPAIVHHNATTTPSLHHHQVHSLSTHYFSTFTPQNTDSTILDDSIDKSAFRESIQFLLPRVSLSAVEIEDLLTNLVYKGFRSTGQMYERSFPIELDFSTHIKPVVEFLESIPGINLTKMLKSSPYILLHASDISILTQNISLLTTMLKLQDNELGKLLNGNAYVISRPIELTVKPGVDYFKGLGFSLDEIRSMVLRFPRVLALRRDRLDYTVRGLRDIGLTDEQTKIVLWKFPGIFALSRGKIDASIQWLRNQGIISQDAINACIARYPTLLSFSITKKLDPMVSLLKVDLELAPEIVKNILMYSPDTIGRKKDLILHNIQAMKGVGLDGEQLIRFINAYPGALRCNLGAEPYISKIKFLRDVLERDVPSTLTTHPMYITYSMDRITTRAEYLMKMGRSTFALTSWLSCNDYTFAERHAMSTLDDWNHYKDTAC